MKVPGRHSYVRSRQPGARTELLAPTGQPLPDMLPLMVTLVKLGALQASGTSPLARGTPVSYSGCFFRAQMVAELNSLNRHQPRLERHRCLLPPGKPVLCDQEGDILHCELWDSPGPTPALFPGFLPIPGQGGSPQGLLRGSWLA